MHRNLTINEKFKHKFALVDQNGECSPIVNGIMREDETGALLLPENESLLKESQILRFFSTTHETRDYLIKKRFHDCKRPIGNWLIKPFVVLF
ncbi:MAG: hypothetical protein GKR92_09755 [Gammaproteobacteria bacterium]|nr:MAG: hypothetical protein GKR92_09755 [Gammaproteobacteria bacterium]